MHCILHIWYKKEEYGVAVASGNFYYDKEKQGRGEGSMQNRVPKHKLEAWNDR